MSDRILAIITKYIDDRPSPKGEGNVQVRCPFPHKEDGGREKHPSFSISMTKGVGHCFTCGYAAPLGKLLADIGVPQAKIDKALEGVEFVKPEPEGRKFRRRDPFSTPFPIPNWVLGAFHRCPMKLVNAGFQEDILEAYEVGVDRFHQRITWPLHDIYGSLAGIIGGQVYPDQEPKYNVYKALELEPILHDTLPPGYRWDNHNYLWNMHRLFAERDQVESVIVAEGYKAALWIIQCGFPHTVAGQGTILSRMQMSTLQRLGVPVLLFLDNDKAGREGTYKNLKRLTRKLPTYVVEYGEDAQNLQPDDLDPDEVELQITRNLPGREWLRRNKDVALSIRKNQNARGRPQPPPSAVRKR